MKKRLRLKKEVKERLVAILVVTGFLLIIVCLLQYGQDRIEKINSGEIVLVSDSEMDR